MDRVLVVLLFVCGYGVQSQQHFVPEATLEFLNPKGLMISLPGDNPDIRQVAFHINVNQEFYGVEHGQFAADIIKRRDGRWSWVIPQIRVNQGDVIYYWINVIEMNNSGYNGLNREYRVTQANPHGGDSSGGDSTGSDPNKTGPNMTPQTPPCTISVSSVGGTRTPLCPGQVLLDERFDNMNRWSHQVTIGGNDPEDEFMVFTKESKASWVEYGKLNIKPLLLEDNYNDTFVRSGQLFLEGCTSVVSEQCIRQAHSYLILPPIISARLNTKNQFSFRYGKIEIRAKLPKGDWIVPELWLEPVNGPRSDKVVIGLSRGNKDASEFGWRTLEAGIRTNSRNSLERRTQDTPWSQDFHTFMLQWAPDQMQFFVDNQDIGHIYTRDYPIINNEVYISLGVHVAGSRDFPDSIPNKPWKNSNPKSPVWTTYPKYIVESYSTMERFLRFWDAKNSWYPSWNQESILQVENIKITAL